MTFTRAALAATLLAGNATLLFQTAPAAAQSPLESLRAHQRGNQPEHPQPQPQPQQQQGGIVNLSRDENNAVRPLYTAVQAHDWPTAAAALPAAQAAVQSAPGKYLIGQLMLDMGRGTSDTHMQSQAVDYMIASGGAPAEVLPQLFGAQAAFFIDANNLAAAEAPLNRLLQLDPNNVERITQLGQVELRLGKRNEALALYRRALQLGEAGGQHAPEQVYRTLMAIAYEGRMAQPAIEQARALVAAYPTPENWQAALGVYNQLAGLAGPEQLDLYRFMRAAGALHDEHDYFEYAMAVNHGGFPGETKAVIEEGFGRNIFRQAVAEARQMLTAATARIAEDQASLPRLRTTALAAATGQSARTTADAYFGYGRYAEAAELYRAALQKGGEDANLVNTRLGAALALAGQRPAAEAAFHAVTGSRATLAQFWLLWLASRPAG